MKLYANIKTSELKDETQLKIIGSTFNPKPEQLADSGWLEVVVQEKPVDGFRATHYRVEKLTPTTCQMVIDAQVNIHEETAAILADQERAIAEMKNRNENTDNWTEHERFILWLIRKEEMKPEDYKAYLTEQYRIFKAL